MFACQECGKVFKTVGAAERAMNDGCPKCGGSDIDAATMEQERAALARRKTAKPSVAPPVPRGWDHV